MSRPETRPFRPGSDLKGWPDRPGWPSATLLPMMQSVLNWGEWSIAPVIESYGARGQEVQQSFSRLVLGAAVQALSPWQPLNSMQGLTSPDEGNYIGQCYLGPR